MSDVAQLSHRRGPATAGILTELDVMRARVRKLAAALELLVEDDVEVELVVRFGEEAREAAPEAPREPKPGADDPEVAELLPSRSRASVRDQIVALLTDSPDPLSAREIFESIDARSIETVKTMLRRLRDEGRIVIVRREGSGPTAKQLLTVAEKAETVDAADVDGPAAVRGRVERMLGEPDEDGPLPEALAEQVLRVLRGMTSATSAHLASRVSQPVVRVDAALDFLKANGKVIHGDGAWAVA